MPQAYGIDFDALAGAFLPLAGGTLSGELFGTDAEFSGDLTVGDLLIVFGNAEVEGQLTVDTRIRASQGTAFIPDGAPFFPEFYALAVTNTVASANTTNLLLATTGAADAAFFDLRSDTDDSLLLIEMSYHNVPGGDEFFIAFAGPTYAGIYGAYPPQQVFLGCGPDDSIAIGNTLALGPILAVSAVGGYRQAAVTCEEFDVSTVAGDLILSTFIGAAAPADSAIFAETSVPTDCLIVDALVANGGGTTPYIATVLAGPTYAGGNGFAGMANRAGIMTVGGGGARQLFLGVTDGGGGTQQAIVEVSGTPAVPKFGAFGVAPVIRQSVAVPAVPTALELYTGLKALGWFN